MGITSFARNKINEIKRDIAAEKEIRRRERTAFLQAEARERVRAAEEKAKIKSQASVRRYKESFVSHSDDRPMVSPFGSGGGGFGLTGGLFGSGGSSAPRTGVVYRTKKAKKRRHHRRRSYTQREPREEGFSIW